MPTRRVLFGLSVVIAVFIVATSLITRTTIFADSSAQLDTAQCPAFVEEALETVSNQCDGLGRNSACYGNTQVIAEFSQPQADDFFTQPSERAELVLFSRLQTTHCSWKPNNGESRC